MGGFFSSPSPPPPPDNSAFIAAEQRAKDEAEKVKKTNEARLKAVRAGGGSALRGLLNLGGEEGITGAGLGNASGLKKTLG
jgi:hypothetical protein